MADADQLGAPQLYCRMQQLSGGGTSTCFTDGWSDYGRNEVCQVRAEVSMTVSATSFNTEGGKYFVTLAGTSY